VGFTDTRDITSVTRVDSAAADTGCPPVRDGRAGRRQGRTARTPRTGLAAVATLASGAALRATGVGGAGGTSGARTACGRTASGVVASSSRPPHLDRGLV